MRWIMASQPARVHSGPYVQVAGRGCRTSLHQRGPPGRVKLTAGMDAVQCLRLSNKGVLRWYADCCRTPIGNTATSPRFPVIAVVHSFMVHGSDGRSGDEVLGPQLCRIYERSAVGPLPPNAPPPPSLGVFARRASKIFGWWVLGLGRPSPLFDDRTNAPRAAPRVLTQNERRP
jgi:Family of unknown function (DUF6151)